MSINKIIKNAPVRGVFIKPEVEIKKSGSRKIKSLADRDLFIPCIPHEKITYGPFPNTSVKQRPISQEVYNAFLVIVEAFLVEQAENDSYYSPEQTGLKILELIKLLTNNNKGQVQELRAAVVKGFVNAEKAIEGCLPNLSYKTLEQVLHEVDKLVTENN